MGTSHDEDIILRSLVRRKELPPSWMEDTRYTVKVHSSKTGIVKIEVRCLRETDTLITEYEPLKRKDGSLEPSLFMLKTTECQTL